MYVIPDTNRSLPDALTNSKFQEEDWYSKKNQAENVWYEECSYTREQRKCCVSYNGMAVTGNDDDDDEAMIAMMIMEMIMLVVMMMKIAL